MANLNLTDVQLYVEENIGSFHKKRIDRLQRLKLKDVLKKKNPYLFKAKHLLTTEQIVKGLTDAFISSNEETIFGEWLEGLAIFINNKVYGGHKSGIKGVDLEFDKNGIHYIVNIKSGPNWGNSSQIEKMVSDFKTAIKTFKSSNSGFQVEAVNGCCYGVDNKPFKQEGYYKYCGQRFWEFISGNSDLYIQIIEPIGFRAKERNEEFLELYAVAINKFTREFANSFCLESGAIDWEKFVKFNSGI